MKGKTSRSGVSDENNISDDSAFASLSSAQSRVALPKDDLELRVWHGFGLTLLEGFVLRRRAGRWSAVHLDGIHSKLPGSQYQRQLPAPKSDGMKFGASWSTKVSQTLPNIEEIGCARYYPDGMSYVVELNYELTYKTYMYDNPVTAKCDEAKRMIDIGNFIAAEFGVREMATIVP